MHANLALIMKMINLQDFDLILSVQYCENKKRSQPWHKKVRQESPKVTAHEEIKNILWFHIENS